MSTEIKGLRQIAAGPHQKAPKKPRSAPLAPAQHFGVAGGSHGLDHLENALAHATLANLVVGAHQLERLALDEGVLLLLERRAGLTEALSAAARHRAARKCVGRHFVEEIRHRHIQHLGELEEPARANTVGTALVLLDLLESKPDSGAQLLLAHAQKGATLPHARADVDINWM